MKKLMIIMLMGIILLIPFNTHAYDNGYQYGLPTYQLDQKIPELNNHTLREVFENRNMALPVLNGKEEIIDGLYRFYDNNGIVIDYNIYNGIWTINGTNTVALGPLIFYVEQNTEYTISYAKISGTLTGGGFWFVVRNPYIYPLTIYNETQKIKNTFTTTIQTFVAIDMIAGRTFNNYQFKLQLENGSQATPYQIPTYGPYNDIDVSQFNLTKEQLDNYFNLYQLALKYEIDNKEAVKDPGQYKHIFMSIYEGLTNLMRSMGSVWRFLTTPFVDTTLSDMDNLFSIDWSWDIFDVLRQWITNMAVWILQLNAVLIGTLFLILGIPIKVSILSLVFSDLVFVILGWIMIKSFII